MASQQELAVIYAALALYDDDKTITVEAINKLLSAANVSVEPFWVGLYVKALKSVNVKDLIHNIGSGIGSAPAAPAAAAPAANGAAAAPAKEEKKKEAPKEESEDEDMGFGLFD